MALNINLSGSALWSEESGHPKEIDTSKKSSLQNTYDNGKYLKKAHSTAEEALLYQQKLVCDDMINIHASLTGSAILNVIDSVSIVTKSGKSYLQFSRTVSGSTKTGTVALK